LSRELEIYTHEDGRPEAPWKVAAQLRWLIVRDVLLDPISWLLLATTAWVLQRSADDLAAPDTWASTLIAITALCAVTAVAIQSADRLLFAEKDNELLRVQPLGDDGLYKVRSRELGWWIWPVAVLAAAAGFGAGGWTVALATGGGALGARGLGLSLALLLRDRLEKRRGLAVLVLVALPAVLLYRFAASPLPWPAAAPYLPLLPGLLLLSTSRAATAVGARLFRARYDALASNAAVRDRIEQGRWWRAIMTLAPLPYPLRARLARDLVLLGRGWDRRGVLLILLSPLSCLYLADILSEPIRAAEVTWRVLEAASLGAAAIAYAVGPNIHVLRNGAMSWSRTSPRPGRGSLHGALIYGVLFALLHAGLILATVALTRDGYHREAVASLAFPVIALEAGMIHFAVVYSMAESLGRRVAGEGALILALACVAAALAVLGYLYPLALPLYLVLTMGLASRAVQRYEALEVTW